MADIPPEAVQAVARAIHAEVCPGTASCTTVFGERQLTRARRILEAAEQAWPHGAPKRDPASTITARGELGPGRSFTSRHQRHEVAPPFGFGPPDVTA